MKKHINLLSGLVIAIILVGVISAATVFVSAQTYRDLAFDFQRQYMARLVEVRVAELINEAVEDARRLGLRIQYNDRFDAAFDSADGDVISAFLEQQIRQAAEISNQVEVAGLSAFDVDLGLLGSVTRTAVSAGPGGVFCPRLIETMRLRQGAERLEPAHELCLAAGAPLLATMVPVGGPDPAGYLQVIVNPVVQLRSIGTRVGMPVRVALMNGVAVSSSPGWQDESEAAVVSANYILRADDSRPALLITSVRNADALVMQLDKTNNRLLLVVVLIILTTVAFALVLVKYTVFKPLKDLSFQLRDKRAGSKPHDSNAATAKDGLEPVSFHELGELYESLHDMAIRDPLTGTYNRALLEDRLKQLIAEHRRMPSTAALLLIDMVRFKYVNDLLGHHTGDLLLKDVVSRIGDVLRESDTLARLGGDEFVVILPDTDRQQAIQVAEKIIQSMQTGFEIEGHKLSASVCIGISLLPEHAEDSDSLLRYADQAMYSVKDNKQGYAIYDPASALTSDLARQSLDSILRKEIEPDDLYLVYQPVIDFATGEVSYLEALLRWQQRDGKIMMPETFIRVAEQSGLIRQLSEWVIETACRELALMQKNKPGLRGGINLSMHNLHDLGLIDAIGRSLSRYRLRPQSLLIEITETGVMLDPEQVIDMLGRMAAMGLRLSIDDFGTGHSSLIYLRRLPVHTLKVDKSFVIDMDTDEDNASIVRATIDLAHSMGLTVTAEGVESPAVQKRLKAMGCDYYQGYYISEPIRCMEMIDWLIAARRF
ncbi:MAG: EAL domain-containing protein [Gammaproteobacteria bacterium]